MNTRQRRILESYQRALAFTATLPDSLTHASLVPMRTELAQIVDRLSALGIEQESGARQRRGGTRRLTTLVQTLRDGHLKPITELARKHLDLAAPGIAETLRMPRRLDATAMLQAASAIASCVEPHAAAFVARGGLAPDFVQRLRDAAQQVAAAAAERATEKNRMVHATAALRSDLRRCAAAVRLLDLLIANELKHDPARLHAWRTAKRPLAAVSAPDSTATVPAPAQAA